MPAGDLTPAETDELKRAVRVAEDSSGFRFSVYLGSGTEHAREHAEKLHAALEDPTNSVLVFCDLEARALEIVTGAVVRRQLTDEESRFAAVGMKSDFLVGDIVGGLVQGIMRLGEAARAPRTLHATSSPE